MSLGHNNTPIRSGLRVIRRQYTITNCLRKEFYDELLNAIENPSFKIDEELFSTDETN